MRLLHWLIIATILNMLAVGVAVLPDLLPHTLQVTLYKLALVTSLGWVGYWFDRAVFPYARPDEALITGQPQLAASCMLRRVILMAAIIIGGSLGL